VRNINDSEKHFPFLIGPNSKTFDLNNFFAAQKTEKFYPMLGGIRSFRVGGFEPFEKYDRQIGSFPQVGVNIQKYYKPQSGFSALR